MASNDKARTPLLRRSCWLSSHSSSPTARSRSRSPAPLRSTRCATHTGSSPTATRGARSCCCRRPTEPELDPAPRTRIGLDHVTVQWVQLRGGETLVASHKGAWIQPPQAAALGLWGSMPPSHTGTLETTRHLLDGAMSAGERG